MPRAPLSAILACVSFGIIAYPEPASAQKRQSPSDKAWEQKFLLSETDDGNGQKNCFLSDGTVVKTEASKPCPFPKRAPDFVRTQRNEPLAIRPGNQEVTKPQQNQGVPEQDNQLRAENPPKEGGKQSSDLNSSSRQQGGQPSLKRDVQQEKEPTPLDGDAGDDLVLDRAMKRCSALGFTKGTQAYKSCALEQIRILSAPNRL